LKKAEFLIKYSKNKKYFSLDEIEPEKALEIIRENPTNFGVWDSVLDPATAKVKVEKAYKRRSEQ